MNESEQLVYLCGRWPDDDIPREEPEWVLYEISRARDAVLRSIAVFSDGTIARNSVDLEQRKGDDCPSLVDQSLADAFMEAPVSEVSKDEFEALWAKGVDTPFWFPA